MTLERPSACARVTRHRERRHATLERNNIHTIPLSARLLADEQAPPLARNYCTLMMSGAFPCQYQLLYTYRSMTISACTNTTHIFAHGQLRDVSHGATLVIVQYRRPHLRHHRHHFKRRMQGTMDIIYYHPRQTQFDVRVAIHERTIFYDISRAPCTPPACTPAEDMIECTPWKRPI